MPKRKPAKKRFRSKGKWVRTRGAWYWQWTYPKSKAKAARALFNKHKEIAGSIGYGCFITKARGKIYVYREYDR